MVIKENFENVIKNSEIKFKKEQSALQKGKKDYITDDGYLTKCIGSFGAWQGICCAIAATTRFIAIWNLLNIVFLTPSTDFICTHLVGNVSIEAENIEVNVCYDDCVKYDYNSYIFKRTIISDFGLICDYAWMASITQMTVMLGALIGSLISGWVSDRFGRRFAMRISVYPCVILMIAASFALNIYVLNLLRLFIGIFSSTILILSPLYFIELLGVQHRDFVTSFIVLPDALCTTSLSIFAYLSTTWQSYSFTLSIVSLILSISTLFLPETPRWLMSKGRNQEAILIIKQAAKFNKMETENIDEIMKPYVTESQMCNKGNNGSMLDLIKKKSLALKLICMVILFMPCDTLFFGITQLISNIGPNAYLDIAIIGLIQIMSIVLAMIVNKNVGRKISLSGCFLITGVVMGAFAFVPEGHWMISVLGVAGVVAITLALITMFVFASEQYPTNLRSTALGVCGSMSKIGNMAAPFISALRPQWVPSVIYAVMPILSLIPLLLVPETKGKELEDL